MFERNFVWIILGVSFLALYVPDAFLWVKPHIPVFLGIVMFGIGLTLSGQDFKRIWQYRYIVLVVATLKYLLMPLFAYFIGSMLQLPLPLLIGLVVVGACPGGTAANVMAYLSRANVAMTVTLTLATTLLSPIVTPTIIYYLLNAHVEVHFLEMIQTVLWIVLFPIIDGLIIRRILKSRVEKALNIFPSISIISIALIVGCVIALNKDNILAFPILVLVAVTLNNIFGLIAGYFIAKRLKCDKQTCKAIAFEFGMQDTALGVVMATQFFGKLSALPGAIFSVIQNLTGPALVRYFNKTENSQLEQFEPSMPERST